MSMEEPNGVSMVYLSLLLLLFIMKIVPEAQTILIQQ